MAGAKSFVVGLLPYAAMVTVESLAAGLSTLCEVALAKGMSSYILIVYSSALGALILLPYFLFVNRKNRGQLTFSILCKFFALSLVGVTMTQNCLIIGLGYSSPTLVSALTSLTPAFTFLLSVVFRMEKLELGSSRSLMKIVGTMVLISGALVVTLYKGPPIGAILSDEELLLLPSPSSILAAARNWVVGSIFITIASLCNATSNILQATILKENPATTTLVFFCCFFAAIQGAMVALIVERNPKIWILTADIEIILVVYAAVFGNLGIYGLSAWCIGKKGPFFASMFKPLGISIAAYMSFVFLGDALHVGSIVGVIIIVVGFYAVIWGQATEEEQGEINDNEEPQSSSWQRIPFLQNRVNA